MGVVTFSFTIANALRDHKCISYCRRAVCRSASHDRIPRPREITERLRPVCCRRARSVPCSWRNPAMPPCSGTDWKLVEAVHSRAPGRLVEFFRRASNLPVYSARRHRSRRCRRGFHGGRVVTRWSIPGVVHPAYHVDAVGREISVRRTNRAARREHHDLRAGLLARIGCCSAVPVRLMRTVP